MREGRVCAFTNRVRGLHLKLRTEFFPVDKSTGKNEDPYLKVRTEEARLVRYLLYL